jgi:hypothetical protein
MPDSTLLADGQPSFLPGVPVDGQEFIDYERVRWVYNATLEAWERAGIVEQLPRVSATQDGLLSYLDKQLIDNLPEVIGGFGIIVPNSRLYGTPGNPEGVLTGDIELVSETLDITCVGADRLKLDCKVTTDIDCVGAGGSRVGLSFKLSDKFLNNFRVTIRGAPGTDGPTGATGPTGAHGFSQGPAGIPGLPGETITEAQQLTGVAYEDLDDLTSQAVVRLRLDNVTDESGLSLGPRLQVTSGRLDTDGPAINVIATPTVRTVTYADDPGQCDLTRITDWKLNGDGAGPVDLQLLQMPKQGGPQHSTTVPLSDLVTAIVTFYLEKLRKLDAAWGSAVKKYMEETDAQARTLLSELANNLSECEFSLPATDYCIVLSGCPEDDQTNG